ncbi:MAG: uncharacterized protein QOK28_698 [Actinomycetota bacterium]|jgi:uncharacterized protein YcbX
MRVVGLWRFPVKSLGGEQLDRVEVGELGLRGDRQWGIRDVATGKMLTARREPKLLFASARLGDDGDVDVTLPQGDDLSEWLGYAVDLVRAESGVRGTFEAPLDFEHDADWVEWTGPDGVFHDSTRTRFSLVSRATLRDWDERRFRTNVIVDGDGEDELVGRRVRVGTVEADVTKQIDRCVITTRPQPGIERDLAVLRTINKERAGNLAIGCVVTAPGAIALGDRVELI